MKTPHVLFAVVFAAGCGPMVTEPMPDIPETVEYDTVRIDYGDDDLVAGQALSVHPRALVGDPSAVAHLSQVLVQGTNRVIRDQLLLVGAVTDLPPTSWDNGLWVWDNAEVKQASERFSRFAITEGDGRIEYRWEVGNDADEMLEIFSGWFAPMERGGGGQRGTGLVRFDFDNVLAVDPEADVPQGRAAIAFRAVGGVRQVRVAAYELIQKGKTEPQSSLYDYVQLPDGDGRFRFGTRTDFLHDGAPHELLAVDAAWNEGAEGRASARLTGGSLLINEVLLEECWDAAANVTFADATPNLAPNYEDGTRDACRPEHLALELAPPEFLIPEGDPVVPSAHPAEQ